MNDITTFYSELLIIRHTLHHAGGPIPDALEDLLKTVGIVARCAARRKPEKREPEETGTGEP